MDLIAFPSIKSVKLKSQYKLSKNLQFIIWSSKLLEFGISSYAELYQWNSWLWKQIHVSTLETWFYRSHARKAQHGQRQRLRSNTAFILLKSPRTTLECAISNSTKSSSFLSIIWQFLHAPILHIQFPCCRNSTQVPHKLIGKLRFEFYDISNIPVISVSPIRKHPIVQKLLLSGFQTQIGDQTRLTEFRILDMCL
jgi:hypothetical protein